MDFKSFIETATLLPLDNSVLIRVRHGIGIGNMVARLVPLAVMKGQNTEKFNNKNIILINKRGKKKRMIAKFKEFLNGFIYNLFHKKKNLKIGLYGPPNAGKTSIANKICVDWLGEEMGVVSSVPHETREINIKEKINMKKGGRSLNFNLVDTPGIATKIDYEDFLKHKMNKTQAKKRAKEAT